MSANLIHNSGVNYTLYYSALNYFKDIMENHPTVAKVVTDDLDTYDNGEFPMYPIGSVSILGASFEPTTTTYSMQLILADKIKNKNNESDPYHNNQQIPFFGTDDYVDIHANMLAVLNDLLAYTEYSVIGFEINSTINNTPFVERFNNGLAGWVSTFQLTVHNDRNRCLFDLLPPNPPA